MRTTVIVQDWSNLFQDVEESLTTHRISFLLIDLSIIPFLQFVPVTPPQARAQAYYPGLPVTCLLVPARGPAASAEPISTIYTFFPFGSCSCHSIHLEMTFLCLFCKPIKLNSPRQLFLMMFCP